MSAAARPVAPASFADLGPLLRLKCEICGAEILLDEEDWRLKSNLYNEAAAFVAFHASEYGCREVPPVSTTD